VDGVSFRAIEGGVGVGTFLRELSRRTDRNSAHALV
jgi:hypothetical protein